MLGGSLLYQSVRERPRRRCLSETLEEVKELIGQYPGAGALPTERSKCKYSRCVAWWRDRKEEVWLEDRKPGEEDVISEVNREPIT